MSVYRAMGRGCALLIAVACLAGAPVSGVDAQRASVAADALDEARERFSLGERAYARGELDVALDHFRRAYALAPSAELAFNLARIYERMGDGERAIVHFQRFLDNGKPGATERRDIRARMAALRELVQRQRAQLVKAPPSGKALTAEAKRFFERGLKLYRRGQYAAAMRAFTAAQRFTKVPEVFYNLAITSEHLGKDADAIDYYRAYLREDDKAPDREAVLERIRLLREK